MGRNRFTRLINRRRHPQPVHSAMKPLLVLIFSTLALASLQNDVSNVKAEVERNRVSAEKRLREALGQVEGSVLRNPLKQLKELSSAGQEDIDAIVKYSQGGEKNLAMRASIDFWRNKMEDVIRPYVKNPQIYKGLIIDYAFIPPDPTWNGSTEYKMIEQELNDLGKSAIEQMKQELDKRARQPVGSVFNITKGSWNKLQGQKNLDDANFTINFRKQMLKIEVANGNTSNIPEFKTFINSSIKDFVSSLNDIYSPKV